MRQKCEDAARSNHCTGEPGTRRGAAPVRYSQFERHNSAARNSRARTFFHWAGAPLPRTVYDFIHDTAPVAGVAFVPIVIVIVSQNRRRLRGLCQGQSNPGHDWDDVRWITGIHGGGFVQDNDGPASAVGAAFL
jgi:hypothetical protein